MKDRSEEIKMDNALKVRQIIADHLGRPIEDIKPTSLFKEDLGSDSLDLVELSMVVEEEFGIEFSDEEIETISTVGDVTTLIELRG